MGLGMVIHNSDGDLVLAMTKQGVGWFAGAEVEEARACLFGLMHRKETNLDSLVVEGDCLSLIHKLQKKVIHVSFVGYLIKTF